MRAPPTCPPGVFVLCLLSSVLALSLAWPTRRPALGPVITETPCALPVEHPGIGILCLDPAVTRGLQPGEGLPLSLMGTRSAGPPVRLPPHSRLALGLPVDLNRAPAAELEALPGIGPALARRIVEGRPYRDVVELRRVPGIGPRRLAALGPLICVHL